jgi:hypothetical protein
MIIREIDGKTYNFNPLSFRAIEDLEKQLGYGLYKFISNAGNFSIKEIETALYCFSRELNPLTRDTLQNWLTDKGVNFLVEIINECIIQILQGQPKSKTGVKKKS